jgi:hypothetical protein
MVNLTAKEGFDASSSKGSSIPTGAIIMSAKTYSLNETIQNDRCPCDGRSLNTYDYPNLHKVIGGSYGGAPYEQGITDNSSEYSITATRYSFFPIVDEFGNPIYYVAYYSISNSNNLFNYDSTSVSEGFLSDITSSNLIIITYAFPSSNITLYLNKYFRVPALMPTSSYTPTGDSRDQRYIGGSNTPASLSSSLTLAYHTHNIIEILSPIGVLNNAPDSHTHTIATRTHTTTVNANSHTFSSPAQNLGNATGTSQRNFGNALMSGLAHQHNVPSSTTRTTAPGTTAVPNHTHTSYTGTSTSNSASKPAHSHTAATVTSQLVEDYYGPSYIRVVYYIKL